MVNNVRIMAALDDRVSGPLDRIRGKLDTIGGKGTAASFFGNFAAGAVAGGIGLVTDAVSRLGDAMGDSIGKASDFNESQSKARTIFGESSASIEAFAKNADRALGLSETAALSAAGTFGNLFTNLKLGGPVSAEMSENLIRLGGDLASFNNIETTDALDKLRAGLAGESEPLRALGVFLTEAKVKAEAMALGLAKGNEPLTEAAKVQARYSLILKETTTAQGDFARTSDGLANKERINAARMENAWTRVGKVLLPLANTIMPMVADAMVVVVEGIGSVLSGIGEWIDKNKLIVDYAKVLAGVLGNVLGFAFWLLGETVGRVASMVGDAFTSIVGVVQAVVGTIIGAVRNMMGVVAEIPGPWQEGAAAVRNSLNAMQLDVQSWGRTSIDRMERDGAAMPTAVAGALADGAGVVGAAAETGLADPITGALGGAKTTAVRIARRTPQDIADALRDKRSAWQQSVDQLADDLENRMSTTAEIAKVKAALTGDELARGLKSKDPVVRAQANATREILVGRLQELSGKAYDWGSGLLVNYIKGMNSKLLAVDAAAERAAARVSDNLRLRSPAKKGPLSQGGGPGGWGERLTQLYGEGMARRLPDVGAMLGRVTVSGRSAVGPLRTPLAPAGAGGAGGAGGGTLQLVVDGRVLAEIVDQHLYYKLQRAAPTSLRS